MPDSSPKQPENRIHLYDPVGLINDTYAGYRSSNYTVRPRKTVSYNNFVETTNNNIDLELRSCNSAIETNSSGGLRSYDTFEIDSFTLRSFTENTSSETINGGSVSSLDATLKPVVEDRNDGGLKFVIAENVVEDDQSDPSTPRLCSPSSVTNPKSLSFPLNNATTSKPFVNSSVSNPTSSSNNNLKSVNFSPSQPTSPKSVNANNYSPNPMNSSNHQNYQNMSANSRTQAIAKGRRELMDMVRDLPETFYELSLKDIVEQKAVQMEMKEIDIPEDKKPVTTKNHKETKKPKKNSKKVKKSESKKKMVRSKSVNSGKFFLKTSVFPILGSKKSKKSFSAASSFKVESMPKGEQSSKVIEKEWWRRKSCISSESDVSAGLSSQSTSSGSSTSSSSSQSNSSNGRRSNRFLPNFCLFNGRRIGGKK